jgi:predicted RNA-binding Zn-ribbon protein involved in translation (DUF1610 family)
VAFDRPNYTQIPNQFLGNPQKGKKWEPGFMAQMKGAHVKVLLVLMRLTLGFHRQSVRFSVRRLAQAAGVSTSTVHEAMLYCEERDLARRVSDGGVTQWHLSVPWLNETVSETDTGVSKFDTVDTQSVSEIETPSKKERKKESSETKVAAGAVSYQLINMQDLLQMAEEQTACEECGEPLTIKNKYEECPACGHMLVWQKNGRTSAKDRKRIKALESPDLTPHGELEERAIRLWGHDGHWLSADNMREFRRKFRAMDRGWFRTIFEWALKNRVPFENFVTGLKNQARKDQYLDSQGQQEQEVDREAEAMTAIAAGIEAPLDISSLATTVEVTE